MGIVLFLKDGYRARSLPGPVVQSVKWLQSKTGWGVGGIVTDDHAYSRAADAFVSSMGETNVDYNSINKKQVGHRPFMSPVAPNRHPATLRASRKTLVELPI